jgi:serine/threonine-protein kinase HipA
VNRAKVFVDGTYAGNLVEVVKGRVYEFVYCDDYSGSSVSLTLPLTQKIYRFDRFPPFFEGLLPEGPMLEALLKKGKIDETDLFEQLVRVGGDMVGNVTVEGLYTS